MATDEIKQDIAELQQFLDQAQRSKVKDVLSLQIRKWQSEIVRLEEEAKAKQETPASPAAPAAPKPSANTGRKITKDIRNYSWDQSDKFMKLYVDIPGVHTVPEGNVTTDFQNRFLKVSADVNTTIFQVAVGPFHNDVEPSECKCKIKTDKILVMLKKQKEKETWPYVIEKGNKKKPVAPPAADKDKDPQEGLMDMLKQMYTDGDDDMKRTIAQAMTKSRDPNADPAADMGGL